MAITRKQAKIYALRWMLQNLEYKPDNSGHTIGTKFSPYEETKIFEEMDKLKDSIINRLEKLGDNVCIVEWSSPHVRSIH